MPEIRGITTSVNYGPLLEITLWRNMRHLSECLVVTSPEDERTQRIACETPGVRLHVTDAFTRHGAAFNKGLAMEEGFDVLGRDGWILIWDADILLPEEIDLAGLQRDTLHGARRRILEDPGGWREDLDWRALPMSRDGIAIGYFQLFHAEAPAISNRRPWYDVSFAHAGGGDAYFMELFPGAKRRLLRSDVLHLGPKDLHWFGVGPEAKDVMSAYVVRNGWRVSPHHDRTAVDRIREVQDRVHVPGYAESTYELPFMRRAQSRGGPCSGSGSTRP